MEENIMDLVKKVKEIQEKKEKIEKLQSDKEKISKEYDKYEKLTSTKSENDQENLYNIRKFKDVKRDYEQISNEEKVMQKIIDDIQVNLKLQLKELKKDTYKEINEKQEFIDIMEQGMKVAEEKGKKGTFDHKIPLINRRKAEIKELEEKLQEIDELTQVIDLIINGEYQKPTPQEPTPQEPAPQEPTPQEPIQQRPMQTKEYKGPEIEIQVNAQKNEVKLNFLGKEVAKNEAILDKEEIKSLYKRININDIIKETTGNKNIFYNLSVKRKLDPSIVKLLQDKDNRYLLEDYILSVETRTELLTIDKISYNLKDADKKDVIAISKYAKHAKKFAEIEGELAKGPIGRTIDGIKSFSGKLFGKVKTLAPVQKIFALNEPEIENEEALRNGEEEAKNLPRSAAREFKEQYEYKTTVTPRDKTPKVVSAKYTTKEKSNDGPEYDD